MIVCEHTYAIIIIITDIITAIIASEALSKRQIFRDLFIILLKHLLALMLPNSEFRGSPVHESSPMTKVTKS